MIDHTGKQKMIRRRRDGTPEWIDRRRVKRYVFIGPRGERTKLAWSYETTRALERYWWMLYSASIRSDMIFRGVHVSGPFEGRSAPIEVRGRWSTPRPPAPNAAPMCGGKDL